MDAIVTVLTIIGALLAYGVLMSFILIIHLRLETRRNKKRLLKAMRAINGVDPRLKTEMSNGS